MKVTMLNTMCGPEGNAFPGTVLNLPDAKAKELIEGKFAREYDAEKDRKAKQHGLVKAEK